MFTAQLLALEILANFCYTEGMCSRNHSAFSYNTMFFWYKIPPCCIISLSLSVSGGEGEWEDVEEEEVIGGETESEEAPMELEPQQNVRQLHHVTENTDSKILFRQSTVP